MTENQVLEGTVIFKLANEGSKSESKLPFLQVLEDGLEKEIPLYLKNSNPFENNKLKEYEGKSVKIEGYEKNGTFVISQISS